LRPSVAIDAFQRPSSELTSAELSAISDVVIQALVTSKADYPIRSEPHRVAIFNAEQQHIADGGYSASRR